MTEQVIFELCERLGTTVNNLIPKVIELGILNNTYALILGFILLLIGILCFIKLHFTKDDLSWVWFVCLIFGMAGTMVGIGIILCSGYDLYLWKTVPDTMAYKTLLNWIK